MAVIFGTNDGETIRTKDAISPLVVTDDEIWGLGGNDQLFGGLGQNTLYGGSGRDVLGSLYEAYGTSGLLYGGSDEDTLGVGRNCQAYGGTENDSIFIGAMSSGSADGGLGDDILYVNFSGSPYPVRVMPFEVTAARNVTTITGFESMSIEGSGHADYVFCDAGDDVFNSGGGSDTFYGGNGDDLARLALGDDVTLMGGSGIDELRYTLDSGDNLLTVSNGQVVDGLGSEIAWFERYNFNGLEGRDTLSGGSQQDTLNGGADDDRLTGYGGNDRLEGGDGRDVMFGNNGNDDLFGGAGLDTLYGDAGDDDFFFEATGWMGDEIMDFVPGDDQVHIRAGALTNAPPAGTPVTIRMDTALGAVPQFVLVRDAATGDSLLYWDSNGTALAGRTLVCEFDGILTLASQDIVLY